MTLSRAALMILKPLKRETKMKNLKTLLYLFIFLIFFSGCQTIKKKSDDVAERENEKFGLFVGKNVNEMRMELGSPKEDYIAENGNEILVYKTKKNG